MKFSKPIVSIGDYSIPTEKGTRKETITENRLLNWANKHTQMQKNGLRIPAPWSHDGSKPIQVGNDGTLKSSKDNAGFWEKLWVDNGTLWGILDVPSMEDAAKVGKSVQETSIFVRPSFTDGKGSKWEDSLMHIALVTHPVESGQGNFVPEKEGLTLSMSQYVSENTQMNVDIPSGLGTLSLNELLKKLREVAEIGLPENTTESNLIDRLMSALMQKEISDKDKLETGNTRRPPSKSIEQPSTVAIAMAFNAEQIKSIVDSKVINPETSEAFTEEDLVKGNEPIKMSQVSSENFEDSSTFQNMKSTIGFLMSHNTTQSKVSFAERIKALIQRNSITEEYAETNLNPLLESFKMSFVPDSEGNPAVVASPLEAILTALENQPTAKNQGLVMGYSSSHGTEQAYSIPASGVDPSPSEADDLVKIYENQTARTR